MKKAEKEKVEECPAGLTPVEEAQALRSGPKTPGPPPPPSGK